MNILVTGGMGFIGTHLVNKLSKKHKVDILDLKNGFDIRTDLKKYKFPEEYDLVYHLAALRIVPLSFELSRDYFDTNVYGTYKVLDFFKCRIVNISTSSASNPISPYGLSKLLAEKIAEFYDNVVSLRLFSPFGKGDLCPDLVIPIFANAMKKNQPVFIHSDGEQARDFTYIDDVVDEIIWHGEHDTKGVHQVGYGEAVTINQLFKLMADFYEYRKPPIYLPKRMGDQEHTQSKHKLHIKPIGFNEGLNRTMEEKCTS